MNKAWKKPPETKREFQKNISDPSHLMVRSSTGALVSLDTIATITERVGPLSVNHSGQFPSVTWTC